MSAKVIAVANNKGGVGKTALVTNIGAAFARRGLKTLLVDLDSQANLTDAYLEAEKVETFIAEALRRRLPLPTIPIRENLYIVPSSRETGGLAEDAPERLKAALKPLLSMFDYVLIDTPPTIGLLTISALYCAQELIVPLTAEPSAYKGLNELSRLIGKVGGKRSGVRLTAAVLTFYDDRKNLSKFMKETIEDTFKSFLCHQTIRRSVSVAEASLEKTDVLSYDNKSKAAADYENLADELLSRLQE